MFAGSWLWLASLALAAEPEVEGCKPLAEEEFVQQAGLAQQALYNDDNEIHKAIVTGLFGRIECLAFVPRPEQWSNLLLGVAIANFSAGTDWETPLTTALYVDPYINRLVGEAHPISSWKPPTRPAPTASLVPEGIRVFFDGELVSQVPPAGGLHLVQRRTGDGLDSRLLEGDAIPADWLEVPDLKAGKWDPGWGHVGLNAGLGLFSQRGANAGAYLPVNTTPGPGFGANVQGFFRFVGPVGVRFDAGISSPIPVPIVEGWVGLGVQIGDVTLGAGGGVRSVSVIAGEDREVFWIPEPAVSLAWRPGVRRLTIVSTVGGTAALVKGQLRGSWVLTTGKFKPYVGGNVNFARTTFEQSSSGRLTNSDTWAIQAEFGIAWGRKGVARVAGEGR
jgi:hypothetical protein